MTYVLLRTVITLISLSALLAFGWGTYQQIKGQAETNKEMKRVAENIKKANALTATTVQSMKPLVETAAYLQKMNEGLSATGQLLTEMNRGLAGVTKSERSIIFNLAALNHSIGSTQSEIKRVSLENSKLVGFTRNMKTQVQTEYGSMQKLNLLTDTSVEELGKLNEKFRVLRVLP